MDNTNWWNTSYLFRRAITVDPISGTIPADHPIGFTLAKNITIDLRKMRNDYADVVVAYWSGTEWFNLPTNVTAVDENVEIRFLPELDIDTVLVDSFFVYYGNATLLDAPAVNHFVDTDWPLSVAHDGVGLSYTRPNEHWINGVSTTDGAVASFMAEASQIRWRSTTDVQSAIAEVRIDNGIWIEVNLYTPDSIVNVPIQTFTDLVPSNDASPVTTHLVQVRLTGRADARSVGRKVTIDGFDWVKYMAVVPQIEDVKVIPWTSLIVGS